jgi:hypothetical protein
MEERKIVYGIKYYIKELYTEFDIFETREEADAFLNDELNDNIIPLTLMKGSVNINAIYRDENNKLQYFDDLMIFDRIKTIKNNLYNK